jgi:hypothetical protein
VYNEIHVGEMRNAHKILVVKEKGRDHLTEIVVDDMTVLIFIWMMGSCELSSEPSVP